MATVKPSIDDQFWFDWSKAHVEGALERRQQAFEKLQNLVLWLWGIYTTFAAVGFTLSSGIVKVICDGIDPLIRKLTGGSAPPRLKVSTLHGMVDVRIDAI